jgi:hypothetical protein
VSPFYLVYVVRPDSTPLWIPNNLARRIRVFHGNKLTEQQWEDPELQSLIHSRLMANTGSPKQKCDNWWHEKNGYA